MTEDVYQEVPETDIIDVKFFIFASDLTLKRSGVCLPGCAKNVCDTGEYWIEKPLDFTFSPTLQYFSPTELDILHRESLSYSISTGGESITLAVSHPVTAYSAYFAPVKLNDLELVLSSDEPDKSVTIKLTGDNCLSEEFTVTLP